MAIGNHKRRRTRGISPIWMLGLEPKGSMASHYYAKKVNEEIRAELECESSKIWQTPIVTGIHMLTVQIGLGSDHFGITYAIHPSQLAWNISPRKIKPKKILKKKRM